MRFSVRLAWTSLVVMTCLTLASLKADAQRSPRMHQPPPYLNRLRGRGHRVFAGVGPDYLAVVAMVYNRTQSPGEAGLWRQHIERCIRYHDDFARVANFFQVPTAFVAGIILHESRCVMNARDWAGGRGLAQLTYTSRAVHVRPLERALRRPIRYRSIRHRGRVIPYTVEDHLLVAMMHWAFPERLTRWCLNRRGCGILGYNMNPRTFASRAGRLRRTLGRVPTFIEISQTLPCIRGPHGRCPREYVARVLAASFAYQRYIDGVAQTPVRVEGDGTDPRSRELLTAHNVPGFDPARDRAFSSNILPR